MSQSSLSLMSFSADAHTLTSADFTAKHGNAFLIHAGLLEESARPILRTLGDHDKVGGREAAQTMQVYPVRPKLGNVFPDFISVGRAPNNDLVIAHSSVSKFQAFLRPHGARGAFVLQDAGSSNGTSVNGERVAQKGQGDPVALVSGMNVTFGSVEMSFLDAEALRQMIQLLAPAGAIALSPLQAARLIS